MSRDHTARTLSPQHGEVMHDPCPDFMPAPPPTRPLPSGKQSSGPMPDQDRAQPQGRHHPPEDPVAPENFTFYAHDSGLDCVVLEQAALQARVGRS